jgi:hypothetical protein
MKNHKLYEHELQIGPMKQANTSIGGQDRIGRVTTVHGT